MFEPVLGADELWIGEMRSVIAGVARVLVVRLEQGHYAYHDRCPHQGVPLSEGELARGVITCRAHRHCFDAESGRGINPERPCLIRLPLRCEAGRIWVQPPQPHPREGLR